MKHNDNQLSSYAGLLIIIAVFVSGCVGQQEVDEISKEVKPKTEDGFTIAGNFYEGDSSSSIILLHMLNRNRNDWNDFAGQLQKEGYNVLSIDLRGHGQSTDKDGRVVNWQTFSANDFNDMILDVKVAKQFLENKGIGNVSIVGASIGANIALSYAAEDSEIKTIILLSPGLDYRGVKPDADVKDYGNRSMLIVASKDDEYSAASSKNLIELAVGKKELKLYENAGHGTKMFLNTDLDKIIINWLRENGS